MTDVPVRSLDELSTKTEWAAALTAARERADLSIRELARRTGIPHPTLGGYFSGRNLPQAGQVSTLTTVLRELGIDDDETERWLAATRRVRAGTPARRPPSPYPGLASFGVDDAAVFFGRTDETRALLDRLAGFAADPGPSGGLLAVVGASGSGKSSLLRAGVAATLVAQGRSCTVVTPGSTPMTALAGALDPGPPQVLVVDQFEEVFTALNDTDDAGERARFLDALRALPTATPPTLVVLGMRADFYAPAAREPGLVPVLQHAQIVLGPLRQDALRQAVTAPAEAVGVTVGPGLVDLVLADASPRRADGPAHDAGALPLISHALLSAWNGGSTRTLTVEDYRTAGGVDGAVQHSAEQAFAELDEVQQAAARALFLRLIHLSDDVTVTRRRVSGGELAALQDDAVDAVVDAFVDRRLLTADGRADARSDGDSIEISHEALLSAWPRLRSWIDADRAALRLHRAVTEAANAWADEARDETLLWRGGRLEAAAELADDPGVRTGLNAVERDFVRAGVDAAEAQRDRARSRTRRLRRLLASVAALALVAAGLAAYSAVARSDADSAERAASTARDQALSRQLAAESQQLATSDPALAQQLALAAYRVAPTTEARGVLIDASARPVVTRVLGRFGYTPLAMAAGRGLAAVGQTTSGEVRLLTVTADRPHVLATLRAPSTETTRSVTAATFSPDGRTLFVASAVPQLVVWDVAVAARPRRVATVELGGFRPHALAVTPDGRQLVVGGGGSRPVRRYAVGDPAAPRALTAPGGVPADLDVQTVAVSADARYLVAGGRDSTVYLWRTADLARPRSVEVDGNLVFSSLFTPGRLYVGHSGGGVDVFDPASGRRLGQLRAQSSSWSLSLALSPDGRTIGVGTSDNNFRQYSTRTFKLLDGTPNPAQVTGAAYLPDGSGVVVTCGNGAVYVKPFHGRSLPTAYTAFNLAFDADGGRLMVASDGDGGSVQVFDVRGTPHAVTRPIPMTGTSTGAGGTGAINPAGTLVASGNFAGQVQLYDVRDPRRPQAVAPPFRAAAALVESMAISPDGRLLAVAGDDKVMSLWDITTPARPRLLSRERGGDIFYSVAFSPDGTMVAAGNVDSHAYLWTITDPRHPRLRAELGGFDQEVWGVAFSRDSRLLAATGSDTTTRLWDVRGTGRPVADGAPLTGPTDYALGAAFNRDGTELAVASNDRTVRLYDLTSDNRTPIATLDAVGGAVFGIAYSPDGRTLVGSGRSDQVAIWTTDPDAYARRVCGLGGDGITRAEWTQYVRGAAYSPPCR